ncbi:MAG: glutaredoxin 3 [Gammaproteobacteria bacterium]|jgi:glutaredoxin 3
MAQPESPKIQMYSSSLCPYCMMAGRLLNSKGVAVELLNVDGNAELRAQMQARSGRTSVPQIFIDELHVGGCDELHALEQTGKLDSLLTGDAAP